MGFRVLTFGAWGAEKRVGGLNQRSVSQSLQLKIRKAQVGRKKNISTALVRIATPK